ncbi:MAG: BatD family protein, partial [Acidobacteriota bacterium]
NSLRFVNGVASRSLTFTWHLQPLEIGKARVHSAFLRVDGQQVDLPAREIDVLETAPPGRRRQRARDPFRDPFFSNDPFESLFDRRRRRQPRRQAAPPKIYLSAEARPTNPYVGQQVLYTLYLFTQADIRSVNPDELPEFKGFWTRVIPQPEQLEPDMMVLDGENIGKVVLLQRALFARRAGRFDISPVSARLSALVPDSGPFGSLLPRTREIARSSNPLEINVRPLPPAPEGFNGAVGQLRINAELTPTELEVGEAATLSLTLTGKGHFQGLAAPRLPTLEGVRVFPPQQQSRESVRRKNVSGERNWSFVLVPENPGTWELPPIEVVYFDPAREQYRTATAKGLSLDVRGSTSMVQSDGQSIDLHPIRTAVLPSAGAGQLSAANLRPWAFGLPWGLALTALLLRRRNADSASHRNDHKRLLQRLKAASEEEQPRRAAAEMEEAWRDFLSARWELPRGSASTQWGHLLAEKGAPRAAADDLVGLADDLHYLRYAPQLSSTAELRRDLLEKSRKLARSLA